MVPFVAVIAAVGCDRAAAWMGSKFPGRWKAAPFAVFFLLLAVPMFRLDVLEGLMAHRKDTRMTARDWIVKHIPRGSRLLVEGNTCHLPAKDYQFFVVDRKGECVPAVLDAAAEFVPPPVFSGALSYPGKIGEMKIDYLILGGWIERFRGQGRRFPESRKVVENYEKLMNRGFKIYEISRITHYNQGPTVRVYRVRNESSRTPDPG